MAMHAACESMELRTAGSDSLKLTAQESQIHINGHAFRAMADSLKCNGGTEWVLEGHVTLVYKKDGNSAQVRGERLVLNLKGGEVEFKLCSAPVPAAPALQPAAYLHSPN